MSGLDAALASLPLTLLALVAAAAFVTSCISGIAGYGSSLLMPLVLVPIVGAEPVVPIVAISGLFTNASRVAAFRRVIEWRHSWIVLAASLPTCLLGAWLFTKLGGRGALLLIGVTLIVGVPLRRALKRRAIRLQGGCLIAASAGWGLINGGTPGAGVVLISMLLAAGLEGAAVIATDAVISMTLDAVRIVVFGLAGVVDMTVLILALVSGIAAIPGAFVARATLARMPVHIHTALLDILVLAGGAAMVFGAFRG